MLVEAGEAHAVRMRLEDLVPPPEHIPVHVVLDAVLPAEHESLVFQNGGIARGNRAGVDGLRV